MVYESVAYFAYDLERSREYPNQRISLERDGEFLLGLLSRNGAWRLSRMMNGAIEKYRIEVLMGNLDGDFLDAYGETLLEAVSTVSGARDRAVLERVIGEGLGWGGRICESGMVWSGGGEMCRIAGSDEGILRTLSAGEARDAQYKAIPHRSTLRGPQGERPHRHATLRQGESGASGGARTAPTGDMASTDRWEML